MTSWYSKWEQVQHPKAGLVYVPLCSVNFTTTAARADNNLLVIDTGAWITLLREQLGMALGLTGSNRVMEMRLGGRVFDAKIYPVTVEIGPIILEAPVAIAPFDDVPSLLGRAGILDALVVTFDGPNRVTRFELNGSSP